MIQTHSINTSNEHTLINFNIPNYLKKNFDSLVKFKRVSRTSILNQLIDRYVRFELDQIEKDNKINSLLTDIEKRNQKDLKKEILKNIPLEIDEVVTTKKHSWEDSY